MRVIACGGGPDLWPTLLIDLKGSGNFSGWVLMQSRPSLADCAKSAREMMVVARLHYTTTVKTLEGGHEDFRYLISGVSDGQYIPLFWRLRSIQANMTVRDGQGYHLPYLPSRIVVQFCEAYLLQLWVDFEKLQTNSQNAAWITEAKQASLKLTRFESDPGAAKDALKALSDHSGDFASEPAYLKLRSFVEHMRDCYIPIVSIPKSKDEFVFLHHGVDVSDAARHGLLRDPEQREPVYSIRTMLVLALAGRIRLDIPILLDAFIAPPWKETESLHVRVMLPEGMVPEKPIELVPQKLFVDTSILRFTETTEEYVYSYIGSRDAAKFFQHLTQASDTEATMRTRLSESSKKLRATLDSVPIGNASHDASRLPATTTSRLTLRDVIGVYVGLIRLVQQVRNLRRQKRFLERGKRPILRVQLHMSWIMKLLLWLLWAVVVCTVAVDALGLLGVDPFLALLGSLFLIVLTLAVFALDKPFLRIPFAGHTVLSTVVFLLVPTFPWLEHFLRSVV